MRYDRTITIKKNPVVIWAYGKSGNFVGRLEIRGASLAAYTGPTGGKRIANLGWEKTFERLRSSRA